MSDNRNPRFHMGGYVRGDNDDEIYRDNLDATSFTNFNDDNQNLANKEKPSNDNSPFRFAAFPLSSNSVPQPPRIELCSQRSHLGNKRNCHVCTITGWVFDTTPCMRCVGTRMKPYNPYCASCGSCADVNGIEIEIPNPDMNQPCAECQVFGDSYNCRSKVKLCKSPFICNQEVDPPACVRSFCGVDCKTEECEQCINVESDPRNPPNYVCLKCPYKDQNGTWRFRPNARCVNGVCVCNQVPCNGATPHWNQDSCSCICDQDQLGCDTATQVVNTRTCTCQDACNLLPQPCVRGCEECAVKQVGGQAIAYCKDLCAEKNMFKVTNPITGACECSHCPEACDLAQCQTCTQINGVGAFACRSIPPGDCGANGLNCNQSRGQCTGVTKMLPCWKDQNGRRWPCNRNIPACLYCWPLICNGAGAYIEQPGWDAVYAQYNRDVCKCASVENQGATVQNTCTGCEYEQYNPDTDQCECWGCEDCNDVEHTYTKIDGTTGRICCKGNEELCLNNGVAVCFDPESCDPTLGEVPDPDTCSCTYEPSSLFGFIIP